MKIEKKEFELNGNTFESIEVYLPKTTLLIVGNDVGFIMCGALDVDIYDSPKLIGREVICAKVVGVKTIEDVLQASIYQASAKANQIGIVQGQKVSDALEILAKK